MNHKSILSTLIAFFTLFSSVTGVFAANPGNAEYYSEPAFGNWNNAMAQPATMWFLMEVGTAVAKYAERRNGEPPTFPGPPVIGGTAGYNFSFAYTNGVGNPVWSWNWDYDDPSPFGTTPEPSAEEKDDTEYAFYWAAYGYFDEISSDNVKVGNEEMSWSYPADPVLVMGTAKFYSLERSATWKGVAQDVWYGQMGYSDGALGNVKVNYKTWDSGKLPDAQNNNLQIANKTVTLGWGCGADTSEPSDLGLTKNSRILEFGHP